MIQEPNLSAPIPGQSLTGEPKGYAWERPPEYNTPEEALEFYLPKITDEETTDDLTEYTQKIIEFNSKVWNEKKTKSLSLKDSIEMKVPEELELVKNDLIAMHNLK